MANSSLWFVVSMSLCINPHCHRAASQIDQGNNLYCVECGSNLLINGVYRVIKPIATGGFGITYLVEECGERKVLKILHKHSAKAIALFEQEAHILKELDHWGIPKVAADSPFCYQPNHHPYPLRCLVMEFLTGENLDVQMQHRRFQPLPEAQALAYLKELVNILHVVHGHGYFHRDIKPSNIMVQRSGHLALIDFGTARREGHTYLNKQQRQRITEIVSTGYTPHEQAHGQAERRSDFFALGRTMVFLMTGREPRNFCDHLQEGLQWRRFAPHYSDELKDFIDGLMHPDVAQRPPHTQAILDRLAQWEPEIQTAAIAPRVDPLATQQPAQTQIQIQGDRPKYFLMAMGVLVLLSMAATFICLTVEWFFLVATLFVAIGVLEWPRQGNGVVPWVLGGVLAWGLLFGVVSAMRWAATWSFQLSLFTLGQWGIVLALWMGLLGGGVLLGWLLLWGVQRLGIWAVTQLEQTQRQSAILGHREILYGLGLGIVTGCLLHTHFPLSFTL